MSDFHARFDGVARVPGEPALARWRAAHVADINPAARVGPRAEFFTAATAAALLAPRYDAVLDAIDSPALKALLIARCRAQGLPVITVGGAWGRRGPTRIRVAELARTSHDPLLTEVRRRLRGEHGFPRGAAPVGVECVFSTEPLRYPDPAECAAEPR